MDVARTPSAIIATPTPPAGLGGSQKTPDIVMAWPRCAQLAAAVLLGAAATLIGVHCYSLLRAGTEPAAVQGPQTIGYRVELNTATRGELLQLPGVGPALAERIEEYRRHHGGFACVDDLLKVGGIGSTKLEQLRPFVYVRPLQIAAVDPAAPSVPKERAAAPAKQDSKRQGPIDVNTATLEELLQLRGTGIGPKKAQYIIDERNKKPFASVDDLRRVNGIGPKTLEKLRPYVTVGSSTPQVSQAK
jgi:competence protein ComEA